MAAVQGDVDRCNQLVDRDRTAGIGVEDRALIREAPRDVIQLWAQDGPWWAPAALRVGFPILRSKLRALYRLNRTYLAEEERRFDAIFQELDARVKRGPVLDGDRFGLADLTAAALLAPLCRPPGHHVRWPAQLPPGLHDFESRYVDSSPWRWVHEMYRLHRHA